MCLLQDEYEVTPDEKRAERAKEIINKYLELEVGCVDDEMFWLSVL